jgi:hypothetical protein
MTYEAIAAQCGYANASSCRKAIMRELERTVVRNVEALRLEELDSLERLELECWKRLSDKEHTKALLFAVDRIVAIKERRAKLMGLDTPVDVAQTLNQVIIREVPQGLLPEAHV